MKLDYEKGRLYSYSVVSDNGRLIGVGKTESEAWKNTAEVLYGLLYRALEKAEDIKIIIDGLEK